MVLGVMTGYGAALARLGKGAEAEEIARRVYEIRARTLSPDDWVLLNTKSVLGEAILASGKNAADRGEEPQPRLRESEKLLLEAYEGLVAAGDRVPPTFRGARLRDAAERLALLYETWEQLEPGGNHEGSARRWREVHSRITTTSVARAQPTTSPS